MKKNHIAVLHKAGKIISRITTLILVVALTATQSSAQLFSDNHTVYSKSQKGPSDNVSNNEISLDANPPVITYTPLASTCTTGNRTLTATITDVDGVPTSGSGLPVLYWQINSGLFVPAPAPTVSGSNYTFTFGNGALPGNLVSYYIVAQDNLGHVIAKPSAGAGGYTANPPKAATDPTSPDFYVIQTTLAAGTYTVGAGGSYNYLTLTDAVNAYNNSCLSGAVIFQLMDAAYDVSEVFPITISNAQASATNTLTIKPNTGINTVIQGTASDAIIKLNGADYITIDGSNNGGTTRNLTFINNSNALTSSVIWVGSASASNGATHNTVKNCIVQGNAGTTTYAGIAQCSGVIMGNAAETANTDNTYLNNSINTCYYGMLITGPAAGGETNNVVSTNLVGSTQTVKKLGYRGIYIANQTNIQVFGNTVNGINSSMGVGSDTEPTGGIIISGVISGGSVAANFVNDIRNSSVGGWPSYGISLQSTSAAANFKVYNNMIHSTVAYGNTSVPGNNGIGIALISGGGYGIFYNSVHLYNPQIGPSGGISSCLFIGPGITGTASVDVRNNIFSDRRPASAGTHYAIYCSVANIIFSNINYNDYYSTSFLGYLGSNRATIGSWQTATAMDGNSVAVDPIFASPSTPPIDLHLNPISPLNNQGTAISGITVDIDATTRSATATDIGADEFTPPACLGNSGGTAVADFYTVCTSGAVILSASNFSYGLGIAYQWEKSTDNFATPGIIIPGETNPTSANPGTINVNTCYRLKVTCNAGAAGYSNVVCITVYNPNILTTTAGSRCGPGTVNLAATGTPTTAIQWYTVPTGGIPVYTGSPFTTPVISATTPYYVESTYLGSSGSVGLHDPSLAPQISTQLTSWQVYFNVIQPTKLLTVDVYPLAAGENSIIDIYNSSNTVIASVFYTTTVSGGNTVQTIDMGGIPLPIGNGYYMYATNGLPPTGLTRNLSGATYPYNSSDIVITGNEFNQNYYMCYYNWRFSNGCSSSPRTMVTATVGSSATLNVSATPASICAGGSTNLNVTSSNTSFTYTWQPGNLSGASQTLSPSATTTYTVNATDGTCTSTGTVTVTVNPASSAVVINPASVTKCSSSGTVMLQASGGDIVGVPILTEGFNAVALPSGWSVQTTWAPTTGNSTGTAANITNAGWTLRANNYTYGGNTFRSNDLSQFIMTNSAANPAITRTLLISPSFSLNGFTSAALNFWQYFGSSGDLTDSICVEISQNLTTWATVYSSHSSKGLSTINWNNASNVSLNTWLGNATNYIRFRYYGTNDYQWAIDNISITGSNSGAPITWAPTTGLFTNAAGSTAYSGSATATVYANPASTTTYTATATPVNACASTQTVTVTVNSVSALVTPTPNSPCPSAAVVLSFALTGTGPWNLTYTDGTTPVTVNNITTSPYTVTIYPAATVTYSIAALSDVNCTATASEISSMNSGNPGLITIAPSAVATWQGTVDNDWNNLSNWCGGIPVSTKDVVIPTSVNPPVITGITALGKNITISSGATLTISSGATLAFKGNMVNDGTIVNNGTILLNGTTAQSFPGGTTGTITAMNTLEVNNNAGATFNKKLAISKALLPTAGNITLNDTVRLISDISTTARVGQLGATAGFTYNGLGTFSIERYISTLDPGPDTTTAWRFLAAPIAPLTGGQTINQAWQEGQAAGVYNANGYGMMIVGPASAGTGFDLNTNTPSLKKYNPATNGWTSVPGTGGAIATTEGYMAFIRGDRGAHTLGAASTTRLRTAGHINTGNTTPLSTTTSGGFISVGNPYPSAIDFTATTRNGLSNTYYLWDPKIGMYGGYQVFTSPTYNPVPGGGSYSGGNKFIESGQAFFVVATLGAPPHNISFSESAKVASTYQTQRVAGSEKQLFTRLFAVNTNSTDLTDGNLVEFDPMYSNSIDDLDAPKLSNFGENLGIWSNDKLLSIERRTDIISTDTIFYQLGQLRQIGYQFEFTPQNLAGLSACLEDSYLHTSTAINMNVVSIVDFNITADPASKAADRFRLVFRQLGPVPVRFTTIAAYRKEKDIMVEWKVDNEANIDHYEIERSHEGRSFIKIGELTATGNNSGQLQKYNWLDKEPFAGDNFYRIRSVETNAEYDYSEVVKVNLSGDGSMIVVYPNPVKDGYVGVSFNEQPEGQYDIKLFGSIGQLIFNQRIIHQGGSERIKFPVGPNLAKGVYNLEIILPAKKRKVFKVVIE